MIEEALAYLTSRMASQSKFSFEIIVVDDGSVDNTYQVSIIYSDDSSSRLHFHTLKNILPTLSGF